MPAPNLEPNTHLIYLLEDTWAASLSLLWRYSIQYLKYLKLTEVGDFTTTYRKPPVWENQVKIKSYQTFWKQKESAGYKAQQTPLLQTTVFSILLNTSKCLCYRAGQWRHLSKVMGYHHPPHSFGQERLGWTMVQPSHICLSCRDSSKEKLLIRSWFIFQRVLPQGVPCASQAPKEVTWSDLTIPH